MAKTLKQLRADSKMTHQQILEKMREVYAGTPETHVGLIHIENRGTDRLPVLEALAHAYDLPLDVIRQAADPANIKCSELVQIA